MGYATMKINSLPAKFPGVHSCYRGNTRESPNTIGLFIDTSLII